jgi:hypothetical protein
MEAYMMLFIQICLTSVWASLQMQMHIPDGRKSVFIEKQSS